MAQEAWRAYLELALGMTDASRKKAAKAVKKLVGKGGATAEQLQTMAEDLLKTGTSNREGLTKLVRIELDRALARVGLAKDDEVAELAKRVRDLEEQLRKAQQEAGTDSAGPAATAAPAAPAADGQAPRPTKPAATVAKKAVAKKAPAKKAVAKKAVAKKAVAKEAPAEKAPAKKAPAKKAPTTRAPAKKTTAAPDSTVAKKAVAKKAVAAKKTATGGVGGPGGEAAS